MDSHVFCAGFWGWMQNISRVAVSPMESATWDQTWAFFRPSTTNYKWLRLAAGYTEHLPVNEQPRRVHFRTIHRRRMGEKHEQEQPDTRRSKVDKMACHLAAVCLMVSHCSLMVTQTADGQAFLPGFKKKYNLDFSHVILKHSLYSKCWRTAIAQ